MFLFDIDGFLYTGLRAVLFILGIVAIAWVVSKILDRLFGEKTTIEPADPQQLLDSDFDMRDHALNEMLNVIYMTFDVDESKAVTNSYQPDLNKIVIKVAFADLLFICTADWFAGKYTIDVNAFRNSGAGEIALVAFKKKKSFKMDKNSYIINYKALMKFLKRVQDIEFKSMSLQEIINDAAAMANDPALKSLTPEQLDHLLYDAATIQSNLLNHRNWRRNKKFFLSYSMLMAFICSSGKKDEMIKYLKDEQEDEE